VIGGFIKPVALNRFLHRRICEAVFLMTLSIIVLYFLPIFSIDLGIGLSINLISAIVSGIALITCGISYFWLPKKLITPVSIIIYWLVICVVAILIMTTGKETSPFIALWMIISLFASIFGVWGWLPILVLSGVFLSIIYIGDKLTASSLVIILASSILPLIFSALIWRSKSRTDELDSENKAFHNLASELSEVSNQSEIVINAIGDGVIAIDGQGIVRLINPAAQEIIGWTKQDALSLNYKSVLRLVDKKDDPLNDTNDPILQVLNANQQIRTNNVILVTKSVAALGGIYSLKVLLREAHIAYLAMKCGMKA
ncbi:PAS domain-containing protein, partial [bacterium]|nr:PAS domain-containing protein [bacterium]